MIRRGCFGASQYQALGWAVDLAEEVVADNYRFSEAFWQDKGRYEIKTLTQLQPEEISHQALAQVVKCLKPGAGHRPRQFFRICLQDHRIEAARRGATLDMKSLLLYVVTHELIHVVRFARHDQLFEAGAEARRQEEQRVHDLTCRFLGPLGLRGAARVFAYASPADRPAEYHFRVQESDPRPLAPHSGFQGGIV